VAGWVARTGQSTLVNDVAGDARFYPGIDEVSRFETRSVLASPLVQGERVVGVIELANRYGGLAFEPGDLAKLEAVAAKVGPTLDLETLPYDQAAMHALLAQAMAAVPVEAAALLLYDPSGRELVFTASRTLTPGVIDGLRIRADQGIAGWVARHRQAVRVDDAARDPRHYSPIASQAGLKPKAMLCVPILHKGRLLGVIQAVNKLDGSTFDDEELRLAQMLADHAAIAIENASLYRRAYVASITDDLTGLHNTRHFNQLLGELVERGARVGLLVLDLDNFKEVVDTFGHLAGSRTIAAIGQRIARLLRPGDIAARFGGDEFVIALPDADPSTALRMAETIRAEIEGMRALEGEAVDVSRVTASVGVAVSPDHARDPEGLFRAADAAMYGVKRARKNAVALAAAPRPPAA
jgi:diguanylate cyclase (GGDEF)-like protein